METICFVSANNRQNVLLSSGDFINNYYFPVILIMGIIGNILSFMVSSNFSKS